MVAYTELFSSFLRRNQIKLNEPMSCHTTFGIGGAADCFVMPETIEELQKVIVEVTKANVPFFILGGGANLLVRDKGIRGVVIYTGRLQSIIHEGNRLRVAAGVSTTKAAKAAMEHGLSGMEFAAGIPGTIGGAAYMNAGAYNGEMADIVVSVLSCNRNGQLSVYNKSKLHYDYRHSLFMENGEIIVEITVELALGNIRDIEVMMEEFNRRRRMKQPLEKKSAGSTFKRPAGYFVGQMIEEMGLKGFAVGDAKVSMKHAGFLINDGHASCTDMMNLISEIKRRVFDGYGVELMTEVQIVGEE